MNEQYPSVVFIPGFMLNESLWDEIVQYFPEHWNIYRANIEQGLTIKEIAENSKRCTVSIYINWIFLRWLYCKIFSKSIP